jgi:AcrR family transcriptional regulator
VARRRDAVHNRARLVGAAQELVAAHGPDVSLEAIAARAGVGIGTLYRHFPHRADLLRAVVADRLGEVATTLRAHAAGAPREALVAVVTMFAAAQRADAALALVVRETPGGIASIDTTRADIGRVLDEVCDRARRAGVLRAGIVGADLHALVCAVAGATTDATTGERYLQVLLDGLTAPGPVGRGSRS